MQKLIIDFPYLTRHPNPYATLAAQLGFDQVQNGEQLRKALLSIKEPVTIKVYNAFTQGINWQDIRDILEEASQKSPKVYVIWQPQNLALPGIDAAHNRLENTSRPAKSAS